MPPTSAAHNRLLFLLQLFTVLMKKTRAIEQSIILDVYGMTILMTLFINKHNSASSAAIQLASLSITIVSTVIYMQNQL